MYINESHERNIPEVMGNSLKSRLSLSRCTVAPGIARVSRVLSQVSTYFAICMTLLQIVLKGCHRPEALFQPVRLLEVGLAHKRCAYLGKR